ncbi:hypothetical protein D3C76_1640530 [compost metagenome]
MIKTDAPTSDSTHFKPAVRGGLATSQQQSDHQAETGGDGHGLPRVTANVGFGRIDHRLSTRSRVGHGIPGLLQFECDLPAQVVGFLAHQ